ncbi:hypothetical protein ACFOSD_07920 [Salinispirillum marinum]|uniref:O-antigen ligase domain-containing protein n=2 Tax=Saccharospirillaceae TaxID=255527 RepID=A0ABV8BGV0_9GAMM
MIKNLEATAIYFFWLACVLNPAPSDYKFKIISLFIMLALLGVRILDINSAKLKKPYALYLFFFLLFVLLGTFVALIRGGFSGSFIDTSYYTSALYFIASGLYFYSKNYTVALKAMVFSLRVIVFLIIYSFFIVYTGIESVILQFFVDIGSAYIGMRNYGGFEFYYIYYIVSPMLIFLICYDMYFILKRKGRLYILLLALSVTAMFLSGTRANMLLSVFTPICLLMWFYAGRYAYFFISIVTVFFILLVFALKIPVFYEMFNPEEVSNSDKLGYLSGYIEIFSNLSYFLFGQGFNAHVWDLNIYSMIPDGASKTELTYLEMVRVFGFLGASLFAFGFLYLVFSNRIHYSIAPWIGPALFIYLLVSSTNPYIFSSNGMLLLGLGVASLSFHRTNYLVNRK